jgi:phosphohistidine phosphatase SixA
MRLVLVRHAQAFDRDPAAWPDDSRRPLTAAGRRRFSRLAGVVGRVVGEVDLVESSRFTRAWQTALLLEEAAKWPGPHRLELLEREEEDAIGELIERLGEKRRLTTLVWVGHEPQLGRLASALLGRAPDAGVVRLRKGAVLQLRVSFGERISACVESLLHPAFAARR